MCDLISVGKKFDEDDVKDIIIINDVDDFDLNLLLKKLGGLEQLEAEEITENIFIDTIKEIKENYLAKEQSYDFLPKLFKNDD